MPDLGLLWGRIERYRPIILTGVPQAVEEAPDNKRAWVRLHLGAQVEVRCCLSKEKCLHASPGDILIDDWEKYRDLWGGGLMAYAPDLAELARQLANQVRRVLGGAEPTANRRPA
jgi:hypothetical protein